MKINIPKNMQRISQKLYQKFIIPFQFQKSFQFSPPFMQIFPCKITKKKTFIFFFPSQILLIQLTFLCIYKRQKTTSRLYSFIDEIFFLLFLLTSKQYLRGWKGISNSNWNLCKKKFCNLFMLKRMRGDSFSSNIEF